MRAYTRPAPACQGAFRSSPDPQHVRQDPAKRL